MNLGFVFKSHIVLQILQISFVGHSEISKGKKNPRVRLLEKSNRLTQRNQPVSSDLSQFSLICLLSLF